MERIVAQILSEGLGELHTRTTKYPWDEWLDGKPRRLKKGEDFTINSASFVNVCHVSAKTRRKKVKTRTENDGSILLQAFDG
jgi:hypothetical protein